MGHHPGDAVAIASSGNVPAWVIIVGVVVLIIGIWLIIRWIKNL